MRISRVANTNVRPFCDGGNSGQYNYSSLFDNIGDGICIINEQGQFCYFNKAYEEMLKTGSFLKEGASIYDSQNDGAILKALRDRKSIKGLLKNSRGSSNISVSASPIFENYIFKGVIAIYREELSAPESREKECVLELGSPCIEESMELTGKFKEIIAHSLVMKRALSVAYKASKTSSTVLIRGESGTGKELVAKAVHYNSPRAQGPFITVNCGAIPTTLLESELFGYEQGAFTGAMKRKIGKFEQAAGGTIFLDEIGDMPVEMQVKLLRIIQEREFQRIGGNETIKCDVRIITATHRSIEEAIAKGEFREDLYYRINVIPINLPSLRERKEDIPILVKHFIEKMNNTMDKKINGISKEAEKCLCSYSWPGNVRELENLIERLVVLSDGDAIELRDLPPDISKLYDLNENNGYNNLINIGESGEVATMEEYEREIIKYALKKFRSFNATGKALGITHKTVAMKARKYNIIEDLECGN
ncbi:MAG: sigma-54 interaction domain-containing protein [Caulobacteraceae bacterium]